MHMQYSTYSLVRYCALAVCILWLVTMLMQFVFCTVVSYHALMYSLVSYHAPTVCMYSVISYHATMYSAVSYYAPMYSVVSYHAHTLCIL